MTHTSQERLFERTQGNRSLFDHYLTSSCVEYCIVAACLARLTNLPMAFQVQTRFQSVAGIKGYSRVSRVSPVSRRANVRVRVTDITSEEQWQMEVMKVCSMHACLCMCLRH